jgi:hemerythrin
MAERVNFVEWDERLSVGIPLIDRQHQKLLDITNDLYFACRQGGKLIKSQFMVTVKGAVDYVGYHLGTEDKIMRRVKYPEYGAHKKEHDDFVQELLRQISDYQSGRTFAPYALVRYLRDWILSHIAFTDLKLGKYLLDLRKTSVQEKSVS